MPHFISTRSCRILRNSATERFYSMSWKSKRIHCQDIVWIQTLSSKNWKCNLFADTRMSICKFDSIRYKERILSENITVTMKWLLTSSFQRLFDKYWNALSCKWKYVFQIELIFVYKSKVAYGLVARQFKNRCRSMTFTVNYW